MIKKEKIILIISVFFLLLSMVIYAINAIIIPNKLKAHTDKICSELNEDKIDIYCTLDAGILGGEYINKDNYTKYMKKCLIYSKCNIDSVSMNDIENGFYLNTYLNKNQIITKENISYKNINSKSRLYEIKVKNSLCDQVYSGKHVDIYTMENNKIKCLLAKKCIEGVFALYNGSYIVLENSKKKPENYIVLLRLTDDEFITVADEKDLYMRGVN